MQVQMLLELGCYLDEWGGGDWPTTDQDMVKIVRWLRQLTGSWTRGAKPPTVAIIGGELTIWAVSVSEQAAVH